MSVGQLGRRESFTVEGEDQSGGLRMEASASGQTGDFSIEATVDGAEGGLPGPEITSLPMSIRVRPFGITSLKNQIRRVPGQISRRTRASRAFLSGATGDQFPQPDVFRFSEGIPISTVLPKSYDLINASFSPIPVPDDGEVIDNLDSVIITVSLVPSSLVQRIAADLPSVDLELPPEAFVSEVDLGGFSCSELYPDLQSDIDRITQRLTNAESLQDDLSILRSVREQVVSRSTVGSLEDVSTDSFRNLTSGIVDRWEQEIRSVSTDPLPGSDTVGSLQLTDAGLRNSVESVGINRCQQNFRTRVDNLSRQIEDLENITTEVITLRQDLLESIPTDIRVLDCASRSWDGVSGQDIDSTLDRLEDRAREGVSPAQVPSSISDVNGVINDIESIPQDTGGACRREFLSRARGIRSIFQTATPEIDLDCSDVPRFVRNTVSEVEQSAQSFSRARASARTESRLDSIIGDMQDVRDLVDDRVENENPCKDQLLGRIDRAESTARGVNIRRAAQSCDVKYSGIDNQITSFEDDVLAASTPISPEDFDNFANRAENIIDGINSEIPVDDRCRVRFTRRVRGALDRLRDIGTSVRVEVAVPEPEVEVTEAQVDEARQQREEVIEQLRSRLEALRVSQ